MHACIEFDMYRPSSDTLLARCPYESIEKTEGIDLWFKVIVEHRLEGSHLRIHNHDIGGDASLTKRYSLIGNSHSEIVNTMILKSLCYLYGSCTIGIGLDHTDHLGLRLKERAVVVEVGHNGIEVHLENRLVDLLLQLLRNPVETETAGALKKYQFIAQAAERIARKEMLYIEKELLVGNLNLICLSREVRTNTYEFLYSALYAEV